MDNKESHLFSLRSLLIVVYIVIVTLVPLGLRLRIIDFNSPVETWHRLASMIQADAFAQFKLELLIITSIALILIALLIYYYGYEKQKMVNSYVDYPVSLFAFFIAFSALLSPYINVAFWGFYDRAEGSFAYLSYLIIFIVAANFINVEKDKKIIFYACITTGILQSFIAVLQFFGFDILQTDLVMRLYIPSESLAYIEDMQFRFANKAYGTTPNPNYLGGYMSLIFPMVFVIYLFSRGTRESVFWLVAFAITLGGFIAPTSIGAFFAVGLVLVGFIILTRREFKTYSRRLALALILVIALAVPADLLTGAGMTHRITSFYRSNITEVTTYLNSKDGEDRILEPPPIAVHQDLDIDLKKNRFDNLGTGRYYIWRKSLGMMKSTIFIGHGLDTFVYHFPHWDPSRNHDIFPIGMLIDKPHNTYLQIGIGVGGIGLLIYLYILFLHSKKYLQVFRRRGLKDEKDVIMLALFAGWLGYLFQGLSNDSVISNAPVFWALFGLSVNYVKNSLQGEVDTVARKKTSKAIESGTAVAEKKQPRQETSPGTVVKSRGKTGSKRKK